VVGGIGKGIDLDGYISMLESERKQDHLEKLKKLHFRMGGRDQVR